MAKVNVSESVSESVRESVTRSPIELFWTAKKVLVHVIRRCSCSNSGQEEVVEGTISLQPQAHPVAGFQVSYIIMLNPTHRIAFFVGPSGNFSWIVYSQCVYDAIFLGEMIWISHYLTRRCVSHTA